MLQNKPTAKRLYTVLLHAPIVNRKGQEGSTAVTNLDLHDISRSSRTYGASAFYVVSPLEVQHRLVERILAHWRSPESRIHHPDRVEAMSLLRLAFDFEQVKREVINETGMSPTVWMPDARPIGPAASYQEARSQWSRELEQNNLTPWCVVFGTGWGIAESFFPAVDRILAPVYGPEGREGYNHLSVRAAAGVVLDRLFGQ